MKLLHETLNILEDWKYNYWYGSKQNLWTGVYAWNYFPIFAFLVPVGKRVQPKIEKKQRGLETHCQLENG